MNLKGIGLFNQSVLHLISLDKKETIDEIEGHCESKDIVEYVSNKYPTEMFGDFRGDIYDKIAINKYYSDNVDCIRGNEKRKYGIVNLTDGLLLLIALLLDHVELKAVKWEI